MDESGDQGAMPAVPARGGNDQPVFIPTALFLDHSKLEALTHDYMLLKRQFFPNLHYQSHAHLDSILAEVKGANLRKTITRGNRNGRRQVFGFLDKIMDLIEHHDIKFVARVYVKGLGAPFASRAVYAASVQSLMEAFEQYLTATQDQGFALLDARLKHLNAQVAHSIFTQKFSAAAPRYLRILELPAFVASDNHAGIQIADLLCSALLFPIASYTYCTGHVNNVHVQPNSLFIKQRYGTCLKAAQFRFLDAQQRFRGGITVSDAIQQRSGSHMFR